MDEARKARGAQIATSQQIRKAPKGYIVPSQSGRGKYAVTVVRIPAIVIAQSGGS